jgi:hypothetical protein
LGREADFDVRLVRVLKRLRRAFRSSVAINRRAALKVAVIPFFNISVPFYPCHIGHPFYIHRRIHEIFITFVEKFSQKMEEKSNY